MMSGTKPSASGWPRDPRHDLGAAHRRCPVRAPRCASPPASAAACCTAPCARHRSWLAFGSVMNTISCCFDATRCRTMMQELAGKVLVNEQEFHAAASPPSADSQRSFAGLAPAARAGRDRRAACAACRARRPSGAALSGRLFRPRARRGGVSTTWNASSAARLSASQVSPAVHRADLAAVGEGRGIAAGPSCARRRPSDGWSCPAAAAPCRGCRRTCRLPPTATASRGRAPPGIRCLPAVMPSFGAMPKPSIHMRLPRCADPIADAGRRRRRCAGHAPPASARRPPPARLPAGRGSGSTGWIAAQPCHLQSGRAFGGLRAPGRW